MSIENAESLYRLALDLANSSHPDLSRVEAILRKSAKSGSGDANYALGSWYFFGNHVKRSIKKAIKFWETAASLGNIDACLELAKIYERGDLVRKDHGKVLSNYLTAMVLGSGQAHYELARSFFYGVFTPKNRIVYNRLRDVADKLGYEERPIAKDEQQ